MPAKLSKKGVLTACRVLDHILLTEFYPCSSRFEEPLSAKDISRRLKELAAMMDGKGRFTVPTKHAERFAIVLCQANRHKEALQLFRSIVGNKKKVLLPPQRPRDERLEETADRIGWLGFEGLYRFGECLIQTGDPDNIREGQLRLLEFISKTKPRCGTVREQDVRGHVLDALYDCGHTHINKRPIGKMIEEERKYAY